MEIRKILFVLLLVSPLCSCDTRSKLEKEIEVLNKECNFRLNTKLEDFPVSWKGRLNLSSERFGFKETREDGVDVYTCGTCDYLTTEFYYRNGLQVGFRTRDPQFGFSIFDRTIGSPTYPFDGYKYELLDKTLRDRGYEWNGHREGYLLPDHRTLAWSLWLYEGKLHLNFTREWDFTANVCMKGIEVFLDE